MYFKKTTSDLGSGPGSEKYNMAPSGSGLVTILKRHFINFQVLGIPARPNDGVFERVKGFLRWDYHISAKTTCIVKNICLKNNRFNHYLLGELLIPPLKHKIFITLQKNVSTPFIYCEFQQKIYSEKSGANLCYVFKWNTRTQMYEIIKISFSVCTVRVCTVCIYRESKRDKPN